MYETEPQLSLHYQTLYENSISKIAGGQYETDPLIDDLTDQRFGITLVIRPDAQTNQHIQKFLSELKTIEPDQYYYENSDIHITVMSIISCYEGFELQNINISDYVEIVKNVLEKHKAFQIQFKGITASSSCILIQGFLTDTLNQIRDELRMAFKSSNLQQSIDKRYAIQTAHSTVMRFRKPLTNVEALLSTLEKYRNTNFGTFDVSDVELVYNDWYQREKYVKKLHKFSFIKPN